MIATLGALVLSSLVAQTTPLPHVPTAAPMPGTTPASAGATTGSASPVTPGATAAPGATAVPTDEYIRRGPGTAPRMINTSRSPGDATIVDSGSTNVPGYTIVVHPDFSADVTAAGTTERKIVGSPQARWLFAKLRAAKPLGALEGGGCMKSMSFGSTLTIAYAGETTPDLSCKSDATTRELARVANVIVEQLHVPTTRARGIQQR